MTGTLIGMTALCNPKPDRTTPDQSILERVLDSLFTAHPETTGILAHINLPSRNLAWGSARGVSDRSSNSDLHTYQPVLIASNTKIFVAATIMRLGEMNKLKVEDPISQYLSQSTLEVLRQGQLDTEVITIGHLLSHTSGMNEHVQASVFMERLLSHPSYQWTRNEQIGLGAQMDNVGEPGEKYSYSDTNYLLLSEIIERLTKKSYHTAVRDLLQFETHALHDTWFESLEPRPAGTLPLAHQYASEWDLDTYHVNKSFDLFGGGGIASTTADLTRFYHLLFTNRIFAKKSTLARMKKQVQLNDGSLSTYHFGFWQTEVNGMSAYGHGGFWGTMAYYVPELDLSIAVFVLDKDAAHLRRPIAEAMLEAL